jgi:hypothetical protein
MSSRYFPAIASVVALAAISFTAVSSAEAHRHRHRHGGVSVVIGGPILYGGYGYYNPRHNDYYAPYGYRRYEPTCRRWGWVHRRSGRAKWRCIAW